MGKTSKGKHATSVSQELTMHALGAVSKKTREQMRFERATRGAVQTLARLGLPPEELAASIRRCLNNMHGPEWHCVVGKVKAFSVHVRYWRGKSFLLMGAGLRIIVFQSAPPAPEAHPPPPREEGEGIEQTPTNKSAERASIKVLRSEMEQGYQKRVLAMASAKAKEVGKAGDLDSLVAAIKASLTEMTGPVWHVVAARGAGDWGCSVAHEGGHRLDFKLNGDRIICWKHAQPPPSLADMFTLKLMSSLLFLATVVLLCVYVKFQGSCDRCCSSYPAVREKAGCATGPPSSDGESTAAGDIVPGVEGCDGDATEAADLCLVRSKILFFATCATMAGATALKWSDRSKLKRLLERTRAPLTK
ncbi:unnamed protein product [Pylaiella littoralis]